MIKYVPFLKTKQNEIIALSSLAQCTIDVICPFFDCHRKTKSVYSSDEFKTTISKTVKSFNAHLKRFDEFYLDNYDIHESLIIDGSHNYEFILKSFSNFPVIPVASIDRAERHINSISKLKADGLINSNVIACRFSLDDFEDFAAVDQEIEETLGSLLGKFEQIDLIFDCRVCTNLNTFEIAQRIINFTESFRAAYPTRQVIVTGSSIPASIRDLMRVNTTLTLDRKEVEIYRQVLARNINANLIFGDYTTVSPNYTDAELPVEMLQSVMTAKLMYTFDDKHFLIRGGGLKAVGSAQYFTMAQIISQQSFFRGSQFSSGDMYIAQKANRQGANCTPNTVIKPSIVSHITYIASLSSI